uniref:Uncharacterized protein n=1 Tax=Anguilla anguilla TaxID=7936 RepID=A0A0E9T793_ANGAN
MLTNNEKQHILEAIPGVESQAWPLTPQE